jgi:ABC-2 type transport system permease protein
MSLAAAKNIFEVSHVTVDEGQRQLKNKQLDGMLTDNGSSAGLTLLVLKKDSVQSFAIVQSFATLQQKARGLDSWIAKVVPLQHVEPRQQTLPTWIIMVVLLVSFIILPANIAEEKEKNTLSGLLQTPVYEYEWLASKLMLGLVLVNLAFLTLLIPGGFSGSTEAGYIIVLEIGSFCFIACGLLLGLLCRTQASARALGVIIYVPLLVPVALSDVSTRLNAFVAYLPSYLLYEPIKSILLESGTSARFIPQLACLCTLGLITFILSHTLIRKRWRM